MGRGQAAVRQVGWFPAAPVVAVFKAWLAQQEADERDMRVDSGRNSMSLRDGGNHVMQVRPLSRLAFDAGVSIDVLWKMKCSEKVWVDFDFADRLICAINPFLWHSDPELSRAYQDFDLGRLDAARPVLAPMEPINEEAMAA